MKGYMGLNIGIEVKKQDEGFMCQGCNPKGTPEEIEQRFFDFLNQKFPKGGFGGGWVSFDGEKYDFDVRMFSYARTFEENGYKFDDMYLAITEFIYNEFSHIDGINMRTYWSG